MRARGTTVEVHSGRMDEFIEVYMTQTVPVAKQQRSRPFPFNQSGFQAILPLFDRLISQTPFTKEGPHKEGREITLQSGSFIKDDKAMR